ncbi:hypothetical protein [Chitinophaga sp. 212800010-3]|uniref:hypothetical protein n=1 Tax=unclassified Chitinophaga TaxID=2619133 RepID=UPI002DE6953C|nr:Lipoprotein [Chitinophaga sp. 212800010-3]
MEHNTVENKNDITLDKVSRSRWTFYVALFCIVASSLGGCYNLFQHRYAGKPDVKIQESTLYNPKYK